MASAQTSKADGSAAPTAATAQPDFILNRQSDWEELYKSLGKQIPTVDRRGNPLSWKLHELQAQQKERYGLGNKTIPTSPPHIEESALEKCLRSLGGGDELDSHRRQRLERYAAKSHDNSVEESGSNRLNSTSIAPERRLETALGIMMHLTHEEDSDSSKRQRIEGYGPEDIKQIKYYHLGKDDPLYQKELKWMEIRSHDKLIAIVDEGFYHERVKGYRRGVDALIDRQGYDKLHARCSAILAEQCYGQYNSAASHLKEINSLLISHVFNIPTVSVALKCNAPSLLEAKTQPIDEYGLQIRYYDRGKDHPLYQQNLNLMEIRLRDKLISIVDEGFYHQRLEDVTKKAFDILIAEVGFARAHASLSRQEWQIVAGYNSAASHLQFIDLCLLIQMFEIPMVTVSLQSDAPGVTNDSNDSVEESDSNDSSETEFDSDDHDETEYESDNSA